MTAPTAQRMQTDTVYQMDAADFLRRMVDYDGPAHITPPSSLGSLRLGHLDTFPGSLGRYAGEGLNLPILTIELASARYMPSDHELRAIWVDLVRWLRLNIKRAQ